MDLWYVKIKRFPEEKNSIFFFFVLLLALEMCDIVPGDLSASLDSAINSFGLYRAHVTRYE